MLHVSICPTHYTINVEESLESRAPNAKVAWHIIVTRHGYIYRTTLMTKLYHICTFHVSITRPVYIYLHASMEGLFVC
jgi:hypothetical protein